MWVTLLTVSFVVGLLSSVSSANRHTSLVVFGGTGDLAVKYLWKGLFNVYLSDEDNSFDFIAAGRTDSEKGSDLLKQILSSNIGCDGLQQRESNVDRSLCEKKKLKFLQSTSYLSVISEEDHSSLCSKIMSKTSRQDEFMDKEVLLYMAISPWSYESVLQKFYKKCKQNSDLAIHWKLGLEKPFGLDLPSAESMADQLLNYFTEDEIFRVDHYLGKPVVQAIVPFRMRNPDIEKLLNKDHVERVEIVLKETIGVEGRVSMYNQLGVVRDIHQNHLTELLTLLAMDLPSQPQDLPAHKKRLLEQIEAVRSHNSLFGQYKGYLDQLGDLSGGQGSKTSAYSKSQSAPSSSSRGQPTFAATVVKINSPRWKSVPFVLVSGKKLDVRESYVRIVFRNNIFSVSHHPEEHPSSSIASTLRQIVFHIGNGKLNKPSILVSKSLLSKEPDVPDNFEMSTDKQLFQSPVVYGQNWTDFYVGSVVADIPAYESVFTCILSNERAHFVSTRHLILSWHIWDFVAKSEKQLRLYQSSDPLGHLDFVIKEGYLDFVHREEMEPVGPSTTVESRGPAEVLNDDDADTVSTSQQATSSSTFLGRRLVTSTAPHLAFLLAQEIDRVAEVEIQAKGSFHLAVSGGSSYLPVFRALAQYFPASLHWHSVHIWQVDERCVPHTDQRSNFQALDRELLRFVDIPFANIHAMPVAVGGLSCDGSLGGAHAYAEAIRHTVPNVQLDLVLLGVGTDGHVASLFPSSSVLHLDSSTLVVTHQDGPAADTRGRMTMTLPLINGSKRISILITGSHKSEMLAGLEFGRSVDDFPVLGVNPINGTITWYLDYAAYTGYS